MTINPLIKNVITRRMALSAIGAGAIHGAWSSSCHAAVEALQRVAPGIFVHRGHHDLANAGNQGDIANLTVVIGAASAAVIDTGGSFGVGANFLAAIRAVTDKPVRFVINTHVHPDHVLGNAAFAGLDAVFVGHHNLPRALAARGDRYVRRAEEQIGTAAAGTRVIPPGLLVETTHELDLGGRKLRLTAHPTAHTDNDLTVFDIATATLITGDLLFCEHVPTLDGSVRGWLKLLSELTKLNAARAIPGHGPAAVAWPAAAAPEQRYLETLVAEVKAAIAAGQTLSQAVETVGARERQFWQLFDEHHKRNVTAAFAELEWE